MSVEEQERALLDLLFTPALRQAFGVDRKRALASYRLTPEEQTDFDTVQYAALDLDASMRCDLILQHMCRALPVTFSLLSSLPDGMLRARRRIDPAFIRTHPGERAATLGRALRTDLLEGVFGSALERAAAVALCDAERGMAETARDLREAVRKGQPGASAQARTATWAEQPLRLAPHVSIALLPQAYTAIKRALCPVADPALWSRLSSAPLPAPRRSQTLAHKAPRLLVARAYTVRATPAEVTVNFRILELSAGFAALLGHLDGKLGVADLLRELEKAGAPTSVCQGVMAGFEKLGDEGMLM